MPTDKLTEAISRLHEAEMQLGYLIQRIGGGNNGRHAVEIQTEVRRARMRVEEFKDSVCPQCGLPH